MTSQALDEALARQAEIIAELRAERDDALRRCDRLNSKLASQKQQLDAATRQRDQLASRLASMLQIELAKTKRGDSPPKPGQPASDARAGAQRSGSLSARRPQSAPPKRVVMSDADRDKMVARLYKKSVEDRKARVQELDNKIYKSMEEKRKGRILKSKAEYAENVKVIYTKALQKRDNVRKELDEKRQAEAQRKSAKLSERQLRESVLRLSSTSYQSAR
ncbi:hypothetical protein KFE25_011536 [Diacronema lutheri]|uniref:Uncharacterized protein n=1 Tax=Diacronema lutheri TaxID=2081491 RepID=A0A8J5X6E6_DIALT|nr:hypothetical protein KFE25_011536 [Diacronema lutheri]